MAKLEKLKSESAKRVEELLNTAKEELSTEATKKMVARIKAKYTERIAASKVLANIDREIEEMKLELAQDLDSIDE